VKDDPAWTSELVACGHDVMIDEPDHLVQSLEKAAG
jgi:hypothetical protein